MDFCSYSTVRECARRYLPGRYATDEFNQFYRALLAEPAPPQFRCQLVLERNWEWNRKPYYNVFPSIVPMLTRLKLEVDTSLIQLPFSALCIRLPKDPDQNPLKYEEHGKTIPIRCMLLAEINNGGGLAALIDTGETLRDAPFPFYAVRYFPRQPGVTLEESFRVAKQNTIQHNPPTIPMELKDDCIRLCCSLCLLENDPTIISPDVLADDRAKFDETADVKYVERAHRRGKFGWNVGENLEVIPHYRRPHMMLAWTGPGRAVPKVVRRKGSVVHREVVERLPTGFEAS